MAKLYGEIAAKSLLTLDKSFARANGQPLDASEVYYSLATAKEYAAGAQAYIGQKIVVIENNVVTHYGIEDAAGNLKELGSKPVGDEKSIVVAEDGTVSLKGVGSLVFERDILGEDGEPTGEKEAIQYQPLMTAAGLVWVEPSKTTVEGLATLIDALSVRVKALEDDRVTEAELAAAVKVETDRATGAEEALGTRVKAIEDDYLKTADKYDDTALAARVKAIEDDYLVEADKYDDTDVKARIKAIEDDYLTEADKYDDTDVKARIKAIEDDYLVEADIVNFATKSEVETAVAGEASARGEAIENLQGQINLIMNNPDTENVINSINEFTQYIEDHGEIADGFRTDIDANAKAISDEITRATGAESALSGRIDTLEAIDHDAYIAADSELESKLNTEISKKANAADVETTVNGINTEIAKKANADDVANSISALETAIGTAKSEAISEAASAAAGLYATQTRVNDLETTLDGRLDALEAIDHEAYATNVAFNEYKTTVENTYATKAALEPVAQDAANAKTAVGNLETRFYEIVAVGGEPNAINKIQVNGSELAITDKTVNITVPTKVSDLSDDTGFDGRITAAQNAADAAQGTANSASAAAAQAQSEVDALEVVVGGIQTTIAGHGTSISDHSTRIGALEQADIAHATEYSTLNGIVTGHTEAIAKKADQTTVDGVVSKASANESAIKTLNETTIPAINEEIAKKANATDLNNYHTKSEISAITGTPTEGKTLVQMISEAQAAATYDDTEVRGLITAEASRAAAAEKANADEIARVNGVLVAALDNNQEGLDSIKELADWINTHGTQASAMSEAITANTNAIAAINHESTGILATAKSYTDTQIAAIPAATAEALGLVKFDNTTIAMNESNQLYVKKVSTDILEQGSQTLILNGGSATE